MRFLSLKILYVSCLIKEWQYFIIFPEIVRYLQKDDYRLPFSLLIENHINYRGLLKF